MEELGSISRMNELSSFAWDEVRLYSNEQMERNLTLYRRHGFVEVGRRPHPSRPGQVLVDMVRKLPSRDSVSAIQTVF